MPSSISTLLIRNLHDVFGENDPARRRAAIDEIFTADCVFYDPSKGVALVKPQPTPGLISSLPGTAGLPPFIFSSTGYPELPPCRTASPGASCRSGHPPSASPAAPRREGRPLGQEAALAVLGLSRHPEPGAAETGGHAGLARVKAPRPRRVLSVVVGRPRRRHLRGNKEEKRLWRNWTKPR